jgi:SAM-dependent methyltransferase
LGRVGPRRRIARSGLGRHAGHDRRIGTARPRVIREFLHPEATVVEIGCGIGRILQHVAPLCRQATGYDISPGMIKIASERLADIPNVDFHVGNGYDLHELSDDSVDVVYSNFVFQHCPRTITYNYLLEANRVLRPGGRLCFHVPDLLIEEHFLGFHHFAQPEFASRPYPMNYFTPSEITQLLLRAGFYVERMDPSIVIWATKGTPGVAKDVQDVIFTTGDLAPEWLADRANGERSNGELEAEIDELRARVATFEHRFPYPQYRRLMQQPAFRDLVSRLRGTSSSG